jgi:hypothetical protein
MRDRESSMIKKISSVRFCRQHVKKGRSWPSNWPEDAWGTMIERVTFWKHCERKYMNGRLTLHYKNVAFVSFAACLRKSFGTLF